MVGLTLTDWAIGFGVVVFYLIGRIKLIGRRTVINCGLAIRAEFIFRDYDRIGALRMEYASTATEANRNATVSQGYILGANRASRIR
jgi:hypothetical protein